MSIVKMMIILHFIYSSQYAQNNDEESMLGCIVSVVIQQNIEKKTYDNNITLANFVSELCF
jgi:hypothetical protein